MARASVYAFRATEESHELLFILVLAPPKKKVREKEPLPTIIMVR